MLHIGTTHLDSSPDDVEDILDEIDQYETTYSTEITVILALIIKRSCDPWEQPCSGDEDTTAFNENVLLMANDRIIAGDKIVIADMEDGAGINYRRQDAGGDMWDDLHPYQYGVGYAKMADEWFSALEQILPDPDPDPDPDPPNNSSDSGCFVGTAAY